jgi:uncharacterized membrane protein
MLMNILLWVLQVLLGIYFFVTGIVHFIVPPGLPAPMAWMYELSPGLHYFSGMAEILAGLGLILPGITRIQTRLTPLAALGLVFVMVGAAIWHVMRGEFENIVMNIILMGLAAFVAYGRWKLSPLKDKGSS